MAAPVHLVRGPERLSEIEALAAASGGRLGLAGVLSDLDRTGRRVRRLGSAYAFTWDREDRRSSRWWPQGITSSADAGPDVAPDGLYAGRRVLVTTAYAKPVAGVALGARVTVVDLADRHRPRYAHVLLVEVHLDEGELRVTPFASHAGGVAWHGRYLHVASTAKGIGTFDIDDVVPAGGRPVAFGHRFLLPVRVMHAARTDEGAERFRYSFLSLTPDHSGPHLLAGEYGRQGQTTRFVRYPLERSGLPVADPASACRPAALEEGGVPRMQGAVAVDGRLHVTTSAGRFGRGSLWTGTPGALRRHRWALPAGPEDLCHSPSDDRLWTVTEYPRRRAVLAVDRSRFGQRGARAS